MRSWGFIVLGCVSFITVSSAKENAPNIEDRVYIGEYFDDFRPQTARDMIDRLPGFTLDLGDDLRGFGGAAGNVLIDGSRPSSKSGGIEEALERMPASQVLRIEIIRNATGSSETAGQSIVANVVRNADENSGRWKAEIERNSDGLFYPRADASFTKKIGVWDTSTKLDAFWEQFPLNGIRTARDETEALNFTEIQDRPSTLSRVTGSIEAKRVVPDGVMTLNGRLRSNYLNLDTERLRFIEKFPGGVPDESRVIDATSEYLEAELGADITKRIRDNWDARFLVVSLYKDNDEVTEIFTKTALNPNGSSSGILGVQESFETVLRATAKRSNTPNLTPEFGAELAYNRLDSSLSLSNVRSANGQPASSLPSANVVIDELRGEIFANVFRRVTQNTSIDAGLAIEASDLSVSGDSDKSKSFVFTKPHINFTYDYRESAQFRIGIRRTVGQLDFTDFAASANASETRLLGGNPDLEPEQTSRLSFSGDLRSDSYGTFNIELFHDWKDDVLEQVVIEPSVFGVGNAGNARVWGLEGNLSIPLDDFISGARFDVEFEATDSDFDDPLTGQRRKVSGNRENFFRAEYRQDLPDSKVAYGGSYESSQTRVNFFADEINELTSGDIVSLFVETTRLWGVKTRLNVTHIGGRNFERERLLFAPDRAGRLVGSLREDLERGVFVTLTFSGLFN